MEGVVMRRNDWSGRSVLVTGHTGFKGGWLSLWLKRLGANVAGYALPPDTQPNMFDAVALRQVVEHHEGDVRDRRSLEAVVKQLEPEVIFHLAAQPLVRRSYREPIETFDVNVIGTMTVLDVARSFDSVKHVVVVTTDKVYENEEWVWPYRENDPLGGYDPYSASKACAEIVTASMARSFFTERDCQLVSARAGNVIGGGDWSADRLVPDAVRALSDGNPPLIRNPHAVRPWQHVLEPLYGYLSLVGHPSATTPSAWNFGPRASDQLTVGELMAQVAEHWSDTATWTDGSGGDGVHEATFLMLDWSKAERQLGWRPRWSISEAVKRTVDWYRAFYESSSEEQLREHCFGDIADFEACESQ